MSRKRRTRGATEPRTEAAPGSIPALEISLSEDDNDGGTTVIPEILLLTGSAAVILLKFQQGVLRFYIHPRYTWLAVAAAIALLLTAAVRCLAIRRSRVLPMRLQGRYLLLAIPLILGLAIPARPLSSAALSGSTLGQVAPVGNQQQIAGDSRNWNVLQWVTAINVRPEEVPGKQVDVIGFVYHDPSQFPDGFYVVRFVITCCVADGSGVGLPVLRLPNMSVTDDSWVRVQGTMETAVIGGETKPAILPTKIEVVPRPADPYLYAYR
jgi:putative membrane protein